MSLFLKELEGEQSVPDWIQEYTLRKKSRSGLYSLGMLWLGLMIFEYLAEGHQLWKLFFAGYWVCFLIFIFYRAKREDRSYLQYLAELNRKDQKLDSEFIENKKRV
jgi:hypothetical protein